MRRTMGLTGLAARARKLVTGNDMVESTVKRGGAFLVLLDAGASERTKKDIRDACAVSGTPLAETEADELGDAIGKPGRMCAAVTDESLAKRIYELYKEESSNTIGGAL